MNETPPEQKADEGAGRKVLRFFYYLLFIPYVVIGSGVLLIWGTMQYDFYTMTTPQLLTKMAAYAKKGDTQNSYFMAAFMPVDQTQNVIKALAPYTGTLSNNFFMMFSRRSFKQGKIADGVFWAEYVRYRIRFDALRCTALGLEDSSDAIAKFYTSSATNRALAHDPSLLRKSIRRVLAWDKKHPAMNDPTDFCAALARMNHVETKVLDKKGWEEERRLLHKATQEFLDTPAGQKPDYMKPPKGLFKKEKAKPSAAKKTTPAKKAP